MATCSKLLSIITFSLLLTGCFETGGSAPLLGGVVEDDYDGVFPCVTCKVFVTSQSFTGNLGGVSGADDKCNADAQSGSAPYKAFLAGRGGGNWVIQANTLYVRLDGSTIGTSDGISRFTFPLTNGAIGSGLIWTGFDATWAEQFTCNAWVDSTSVGDVGDSGDIDDSLLWFSTALCSNPRQLLCIQQ